MRPSPMQVQKLIADLGFPVPKQRLVEFARSRGAAGELLDRIASLPDQTYHDPGEVSTAVARQS